MSAYNNPVVDDFYELDDEGVLAMSVEERTKLIKRAMAEEGIKILDKPPEPAYGDVPSPEMMGYSCDILPGLVFETSDKLADVINLVKANTGRRTSYQYDVSSLVIGGEIGKDGRTIRIESVEGYEVSKYESIKDTAKNNAQIKREYDEELHAYNANQDDAESILNAFRERVETADRNEYAMQRALEKFREYIEIANGDTATARRFFDKAYRSSYSINEWNVIDKCLNDYIYNASGLED